MFFYGFSTSTKNNRFAYDVRNGLVSPTSSNASIITRVNTLSITPGLCDIRLIIETDTIINKNPSILPTLSRTKPVKKQPSADLVHFFFFKIDTKRSAFVFFA